MREAVEPSVPAAAERPRRPGPTRADTFAPLLLGSAAAVVAAVGAARPSAWYDELASMSGAERALGSLFAMAGSTDVVHVAYYVLLHLWVEAFGGDVATLRLLSAIAVGTATAGVVLLARLLVDRRTAWIAGALLVVLPRVAWAGVEARSYALVLALSVWLSVVFVFALRSRRRWWWVLYVAGAVATALLFLFGFGIVLAHLAYALYVALTRRDPSVLVRPAVAIALASALVLPWGLVAQRQADRLGGTRPVGLGTWADVFVDQWFVGGPLVGVLLALAVVASVAYLLRRGGFGSAERDGLAFGLAVAAVPTASVLLLALAVDVYQPRYLAFTAFGIALAAAVPLARIPDRAAIAVVTGLVLAVLPAWLGQRTLTAKGVDWSSTCATLDRMHRPGDAILFNTPYDVSSYTSLMRIDCGPVVDRFQDPSLVEDRRSADTLWDRRLRWQRLPDGSMDGYDRILYVTDLDVPLPPLQDGSDTVRVIAGTGFEVVGSRLGPISGVYVLEPSGG
ncbi:glycosyltransferase family 39 protein [Agromyces sp. SYSU T00194]|uniref:glycosyltransferase family 39 protein n=1 Tax=Agromyces chitinivorans TaxID=3158560 RepID=UPI00339A04E6